MENAAKALVIAGGVLLGVLTLTLLVYMFSNMSIVGNAQAERKENERLQAWNAEWEAYNKKLLYGAEVLTVINKAKENNNEYDNNSMYRVDIHVKSKTDKELTSQEISNLKTSIFTCESVTYGNETGRISEMTFKFVE